MAGRVIDAFDAHLDSFPCCHYYPDGDRSGAGDDFLVGSSCDDMNDDLHDVRSYSHLCFSPQSHGKKGAEKEKTLEVH